MKLLRACLLLCLLIGHLCWARATPIVLDEHRQGLLLSEAGPLQWLVDDSGSLTLDDLRDPAHAARFVSGTSPPRRSASAQPH